MRSRRTSLTIRKPQFLHAANVPTRSLCRRIIQLFMNTIYERNRLQFLLQTHISSMIQLLSIWQILYVQMRNVKRIRKMKNAILFQLKSITRSLCGSISVPYAIQPGLNLPARREISSQSKCHESLWNASSVVVSRQWVKQSNHERDKQLNKQQSEYVQNQFFFPEERRLKNSVVRRKVD